MALYGQISASLLVGAAVSFLPIRRCSLAGMLAAAVALVSVAPLIYGVTGPLSFTLTQLALLKVCGDRFVPKQSLVATGLFIVFAAAFYPLALGLGPFDPFDLGYRPKMLLIIMVPIALWLALSFGPILVVIVGFDLIAYGAGLFDNLWSALFDPILVVVAAARVGLNHFGAKRHPAGRIGDGEPTAS